MLIEREINGISLAVNPKMPNEIFFEETFVQLNPNLLEGLTPIDLCELLSYDKYTPLVLTWELLDKCSFSCPFCYIVGHSHKKIVRFESMKPHIEELIKLGLFHCTLTGGEALLHPDFISIYTFLKNSGVIVEVYSNASLLKDEHIELFKRLPPYKIEITIYGLTQPSFERATGSNTFKYDDILYTIKALKSAGINVICKTPLNKITVDEHNLIKEWCLDNGITFYFSTDVFTAYDGVALKDFAVDFNVKAHFEAERRVSIFEKFPDEADVVYPKGKSCYTCSVKKYGLAINSGFELMPCSETHLPETKSKILDSGMATSIQKFRSFVEKFISKPIIGCSGCEASPICKMCTAKADVLRDDKSGIFGFKVPDGHCETQRNIIRATNDIIITSS